MGKEVGEEGGKGMARAAPLRESAFWVLCLKGFYLSLAGRNLKGDLKGGFQ